MRFVRTPWGTALLIVLVAVALAFGATAVRVYAETHPGERRLTPIDFESMNIAVEPVEFSAADGVNLRGWLLRGMPERPPVVLCHDFGQDRTSLINTAVALRQSGFTVLMFDFRGHGESGGSATTLGLHEKRDVLGAVEFLSRSGKVDTTRVGVYGVGMGAHAAVLASADRSEIKVLVLDSLYPDAAYPLVRDVYGEWSFAERNLSFLPRMIFAVLHGTAIGRQRAADVIGQLTGRDLLLLVPAGDSDLAQEMRRMYETIPDLGDADGNLVVLPATQGSGLYGAQFDRYKDRVAAFFVSRLQQPTEAASRRPAGGGRES